MSQVCTILTMRRIRKIRVFGRDKERSVKFAARLDKEFGIAVLSENTIEDAVKDAPIVTLVTRATEPILDASMVAAGTHINAVGAIVPVGRWRLSQD
jgi:alanine dehydrogenase